MAYAQDRLRHYIEKYQPELFGVLLDTFMGLINQPQQRTDWYLKLDTSPAKSLWYFPSDGEYFPKDCEKVLEKTDFPIAMSKFAQAQVKKLYNIDTDYIPHGVNPTHFYPYSEEKKGATKKKWGLSNKFVVGAVFRNQARKMPERQLEAFCKFAKGKDDVVFFCHSDPYDISAPHDLKMLEERYGLTQTRKVVYSGMSHIDGFTRDQMRDLYNMFDVYLSSTSGEGFGVTTIEAMSTAIPMIITDYTTTKELVEKHKCGEIVKLSDEILGTWEVKRGLCDIDDMAEKLEKLYANDKLRKKYGQNGRDAVLKYYDYDKVVIPIWHKKLQGCLNG